MGSLRLTLPTQRYADFRGIGSFYDLEEEMLSLSQSKGNQPPGRYAAKISYGNNGGPFQM